MHAYRIVLGTALCLALWMPTGAAQAAPYSSHSQIYSCCTVTATKAAMFREAKESGAAYIRLDINMPAIFAPERYGFNLGPLDLPLPLQPAGEGPDWTGVDDIARLSRRYELPVLGILLGSSNPDPSCPERIDRQRLCPPADPAQWGLQAADVAARYRGVIDHFEIWNEPDGRWAFAGEPEDYGRLLASSYDAIKAAAPSARVVLGGTMSPDARGAGWLRRVFRSPSADSARKFDVSSIHLRGPTKAMLRNLRARLRFLREQGRSAPMWVTEHGYPGSTKYQRDPDYRGGETAQAAYLAEALPALALAGADQVFVTLRDGGGGQFDSEGILRGQGRPGESFGRRAAWWSVREAALRWPVGAFRRRYVRSKVLARGGRGAVRVVVAGRFRGPGCRGRLRLGFRPAHGRRTVRTASVEPGCGYRKVVDLALPRRMGRRATVRIDQRFLGNARTGPGDAETLRVQVQR